MVRLMWTRSGRKKQYRRHKTYLSVVCVYAPTAKATPSIKQKFYSDLQDTIDKIPQNDILLMLGDFNARVGVLDQDSDVWQGVLGRYGKSERNLAGVELLEFYAVNELSVMNTWFKKREIHQGTWTHPATKKCHMIDFVVMRAGQRIHCRDVCVMRGANCWTDHRLVRAKLNIVVPRRSGGGGKRCIPFAVHELVISTKRDEYRRALEQRLQNSPHKDEDTSKQNWDILKGCIVATAEETVGRGRRRHPEWFEENSETLLPLVEVKNRAHLRALRSNTAADRKEFRRQQRIVKRAVDEAKEEWICRVAKEAETAAKDGCTRWDRVRRLQRAYAGRRPIKSITVWKEDGSLTQGNEEVVKRWSQHFLKVLNVPSEYGEQAINDLPFLPPIWELDSPPTDEELLQVLSKLKKGKAGGKSGILPELILCGGCELEDRILMIMEQIWEGG